MRIEINAQSSKTTPTTPRTAAADHARGVGVAQRRADEHESQHGQDYRREDASLDRGPRGVAFFGFPADPRVVDHQVEIVL
ncbi:MAG: hypothetical protein AAF800_09455 [Planctomycetota bacterium]